MPQVYYFKLFIEAMNLNLNNLIWVRLNIWELNVYFVIFHEVNFANKISAIATNFNHDYH